MKNIKLVFLIFGMILLSGCDFVYIVDIDDVITEDNQIIIDQTSNIEESVANLVHEYTGPTDSLGMYQSSILSNGMSYKTTYNYSDFNDSITFGLCYKAYKLINNSSIIKIATGKEFLCYDVYKELDNVTINLTSKYKVVSHNADYVNDNIYTWYITKDNANNKSISIELDKTNIIREEKKGNDYLLIFAILGIMVGIGLILFLYIRTRSKVSNKI